MLRKPRFRLGYPNCIVERKNNTALGKMNALVILLLLPAVKTDDIDLLENFYNHANNIYNQYVNKRNWNIDPIEWRAWMQPNEMDTKETISAKYDFIIVGSGAAGSVLANRLTEIAHWKVLLLEAGQGESSLSLVPLATTTMQFTRYNWNYIAEYQPNMCLGLEQQRMLWPGGKALGGSTVINTMVYTRGNRWDYDRWAAQGNPGWSYEEVLPYFIKSEKSSLRNADYRYHGVDGYLSVEDVYQSELVKSFVASASELGLPAIDYNANVQHFGFSTIQATVHRGRRHTHASAFLRPVRYRKNLHILTSAYVTKILIDPYSKEAYGVEYERFGKKYRVGADREVILSAGTLKSPQLLMLAGVGPKQHLEELGIPVLQDLPVGHNLYDHLAYVGLSFLINQDLSLGIRNLVNKESILNYLKNGSGPYSSLGGVEGIGYVKTELSQDPEDVPDIELLFIGGSLSTDYGLFNRRGMNIRDDVYNVMFRPLHNKPTWSIMPLLLHPKSRGYVKLRSKNPYVYPLIYANYFTDPDQHDINTLVAAIRIIQRISQTRAFQKYGSRLNPIPVPGCELYHFDSDDYWRCALRTLSSTFYHPSGTVKMGPPDDPGSVVNHELKVYGIGRLRVVDCSVISYPLSAHTSAPTTVVAEKAADIIKQNWGELTLRS